MADDDDPFGAFGGSDSDSDEPEETEETIKARAVLLQAANAPNNQQRQNGNNEKTETVEPRPIASTIDLTNLESCQLKTCEDPLYLSPNVQLVSSLPFGGGRGYVALHDLSPGMLVMVEEAIMTWPEEQLGQALTLSSVRRLLHNPKASNIVHCLEDFHPTKQVVDANVESESPNQVETMLASLQEKYKEESLLDQLRQDAQMLQITNQDGSALTSKDILRIFLALRYNGLESGLYCHVAMINHRCQPNCVKFLPNNNESDLPPNCSEVRTTRWILAGECLTISYLPKLVSHASRRHHLWDQHRFDIGVQLEASLQRMETIQGGLPSSSKEFVDPDSVTSRVERSIAELEVLYHSTKGSLSSSAEAIEQAKALEVSSLELFLEAKRQLQNDNHLLFIPCLVLHLNACDLVLSQDARQTSILSHTQRCKLLCRTVATALDLLELQRAYWGKDHFDVARTTLDLSQSIQELLAKSSDHLIQLDRTDLKRFRDWSALEYKCQKEHERIKGLYPRDASKYIDAKGV